MFASSYPRASFNGLKMTIFFVHGWTGDEDTDWLHTLKEAVLKQVLVDLKSCDKYAGCT